MKPLEDQTINELANLILSNLRTRKGTDQELKLSVIDMQALREIEKQTRDPFADLPKTMNIYALSGHKVKVTEWSYFNGGPNAFRDGLSIGKEYTVAETIVGQSSTRVVLQEIENRNYNSVLFEDVEPQDLSNDIRHPHFELYNR